MKLQQLTVKGRIEFVHCVATVRNANLDLLHNKAYFSSRCSMKHRENHVKNGIRKINANELPAKSRNSKIIDHNFTCGFSAISLSLFRGKPRYRILTQKSLITIILPQNEATSSKACRLQSALARTQRNVQPCVL